MDLPRSIIQGEGRGGIQPHGSQGCMAQIVPYVGGYNNVDRSIVDA